MFLRKASGAELIGWLRHSMSICLLAWGFVAISATAHAQLDEEPHPLVPADTSSPRATLNSFISECNSLYDLIRSGAFDNDITDSGLLPATERMLDCLDLSELPRELRQTAGIESALFIKEVLDRVELPSDDQIPSVTAVDAEDALALVLWRIPGTRLTMTRAESGSRKDEYLFSSETVRRAAEFYRIAKPIAYRSAGRPASPGLYEAYTDVTRKKPTLTSDTTSPRGTLTRFLDACNEIYENIQSDRYLSRIDLDSQTVVQRIISCLDTSQLPEYQRDYFDREAAVCIKEILDRVALPPAEEIPGIEAVKGSGEMQQLERWQVPGTQFTIAKIADGPRRGEFLFTSESVSRAPESFERIREQPYRTDGRPVSPGLYEWWLSSPGDPTIAKWVEALPDWVRRRLLGAAIWQWVGLLLAIPFAIGIMSLVWRIGRKQGEEMRKRSLWRYWLTLLFPIVITLIPLGFKDVCWSYLTLRGNLMYVVSFCADIVFLLGLMALIIGICNRIAETIAASRTSSRSVLDANVIRIVFRVLGLVAAAAVFLEGGRYLGFPITTLIASAGIGGLALALSAQNVMKDMFGTLTILLDKPYRVGDRIVAAGHDGFVEEIGLRSTRIRSFLTDDLVSVPNAHMAETEIKNIGKRKHIHRQTDLHIPLDTPRANIENAVEAIRATLNDHEGMDRDYPPRVYFNEFNHDSFNIRIVCWYAPPNVWDYYAFCERVNFQICKAFEEQGIQFSLPARHSFWKRDAEQGPLDVTVVDAFHGSPSKTSVGQSKGGPDAE